MAMSPLARASRPGAAILVATLAACASVPAPITEGDEELTVFARTWKSDPSSVPPGQLVVPEEVRVEGVRCTLANDKGTWSVTTPAAVTVRISSKPLEVRCAKDGYRDARLKVQCRSASQLAAQHQNVETGFMLVLIPLAIAAAPVAPQIAVQAGSQAMLSGASAVGAHRSVRAEPDVCRYGGVVATLAGH